MKNESFIGLHGKKPSGLALRQEPHEYNAGDLVDCLCHGGWSCGDEAAKPPKEGESEKLGECGGRYAGHDYVWIKNRDWWPIERVRLYRKAEDEAKRMQEWRKRFGIRQPVSEIQIKHKLPEIE